MAAVRGIRSRRRLVVPALVVAVLALPLVGVPSAWGQAAPAPATPAPTTPAPAAGSKIPVRTADDLPRRTYTISTTAAEFIKDDAAIAKALEVLTANGKKDLETYDIQDPTTLGAYYRMLQLSAQIRGDWKEAVTYIPLIRDLETKDGEKLMTGVVLTTMIEARKEAGAPAGGTSLGDDAKFDAAFKRILKSRVAALPYDKVKDRLISVRNSSKVITPALVEAQLSQQIDPVLKANNGVVPEAVAMGLIQTRFTLDRGIRLVRLMGDVYGELIETQGKASAAPDLWTPRLVTIPETAKAAPVVVAVWDSGVDTSLFKGRLWTNPSEKPGKADSDGNGFPGDVHGIAFDLDHKPDPHDVHPLAELKGDKDELVKFVAAAMDAEAGIDNAGVDAFRAHVRSLQGDQIKTFQEDMGLIGNWSHGTHVAGIVADGNPFVRLMYMRETFDHRQLPERAPTIEQYRAWGEQAEKAVAYFKKNNVRVVNMSWRIPRGAVEALLSAKGVGASEEERAELSRKIFAEFSNRLEKAMRDAPGILFVAGSGNESNDVNFDEYIPAGFKMPNLLTVGAIDSADRPTSFTSFGKNVELYANGYQIESYIPGGKRIRFSGTSMASPQVANLAAKLFTLKPELTVSEAIAILKSSADPLPGHPGRLIIHPKKAVEKLSR